MLPSGNVDSRALVSTVMVKMEWERDESWFMSVAATDLLFFPTCRNHTGALVLS